MPLFQYKAQSPEGSITEGRLDAANRQEAMRQLGERRLRPLRIEELGGRASKQGDPSQKASGGRKHVSSQALENFTRQLASLLGAGVSLSRALHILGRDKSLPASERWQAIHDLVVDGASLADAMAQHRDVFPNIYVAMVRAGETGSFLDLVLGQIADFQVREKDLKGRVISAMIYPAVLAVLTVGVMIFLLTFFIPRFKLIFAGFNAQLPLLTRAIIAASEYMKEYGAFIAIGLALIVYAAQQWLTTEAGKRQWEEWMLKLPAIGPLAARLSMTRFCRMLGTLTGSGVTLITALRVAQESLGNQVLIDALGDTIDQVQKGQPLAGSLGNCPELFPPTVVEMISVAEESGALDKELLRLADVSERELDGRLRVAVSLTEPLMLFIMAAIIGTIFIGMVIPIFSIQDYIN